MTGETQLQIVSLYFGLFATLSGCLSAGVAADEAYMRWEDGLAKQMHVCSAESRPFVRCVNEPGSAGRSGVERGMIIARA